MTTNTNTSGGGSSNSSPVARFLNRIAGASAGQPAPAPQPLNNPPRSPFASRSQHSHTLHPLQNTVARFELKGLGDPFYRLFGGEPNAEYGSVPALVKMLEAGGEQVSALKARLDEDWARCQLLGAIVVYRWNHQTWKALTTPPETAKDTSASDDEDKDDEAEDSQKGHHTRFHSMRALDLSLVLNVLGRSHTQVLLPQTPLMFTQTTLERSLMSDDPRLLALVKATGYLSEEQQP